MRKTVFKAGLFLLILVVPLPSAFGAEPQTEGFSQIPGPSLVPAVPLTEPEIGEPRFGRSEDISLSEKYYKAGMQHYVDGNYDDAILSLSGALMSFPQNWKAKELLRIVGAEKYQVLNQQAIPPDPNVPWENVLFGYQNSPTVARELADLKRRIQRQERRLGSQMSGLEKRLQALMAVEHGALDGRINAVEGREKTYLAAHEQQGLMLETVASSAKSFRFTLSAVLVIILAVMAIWSGVVFYKKNRNGKEVPSRTTGMASPLTEIRGQGDFVEQTIDERSG